MVRCETPKRKLQLMNDSIKKLRRNLQEKMETVHEDLHRPPDLLDQRGNSLRARVVKDGLTCVGPYRSSKSAAEADVKSLVEAGRVSADAVASVSQELREAELVIANLKIWILSCNRTCRLCFCRRGLPAVAYRRRRKSACNERSRRKTICCCLGCVQAFGCGL